MTRNLTDTEALLWSLEQNPNLASTMGAIAILEGPPDVDRLRHTLANALNDVAPLRERVYESSVPLGTHQWGLDTHFDLDSHLQFIRTSSPSSRERLFELATTLVNEPFDRTRPLWKWTVVTGLPRGRAAVVTKLHHSIADGQGALQLAAHLLEFEPDAEAPKPIEASEVLAEIAAKEAVELGDGGGSGLRAGAERMLQALGAAASSLQDPARAGTEAASAARSLAAQLADESQSTLWGQRSRNRRGRFLSLPVASMKRVAKARACSLNDVFVAACARGVLNYHEANGVELPSVSATVVVSTRNPDDPQAHNAIVPAAVTLPGGDATIDELVATVGTAIASRRDQVKGNTGFLGPFTGLFGLLPTPLVAAAALGQTKKVDVSTSNLPGPPIPVWIAGQRVTELYPLGPVAGTACNLTLLSYDDHAYLGLHIDPAAIADPDRFVDAVADGFVDLGVRRPKTR